jgi:hypothetical protein
LIECERLTWSKRTAAPLNFTSIRAKTVARVRGEFYSEARTREGRTQKVNLEAKEAERKKFLLKFFHRFFHQIFADWVLSLLCCC